MKITCNYCNIKNFGDQLNPLVFKCFTGFDIVKDNSFFAEVIGIGSLFEGVLTDEKNRLHSKTPLRVFSTGFGFDVDVRGKMNRKLRVFAVRGKLTLSKLKQMKNVDFVYNKTVIGDGGLLASYLVDNNVKKVYELGIVPHYADKNNPVFQKIQDACGGKSIILDPCVEPVEFLNNLMKCKAVISTAMHPLIACDALRIPNMWVRISEKTTSRYKFHDYYSAFGVDKEPYDLNNGFGIDDIDLIYKQYNITDEKVRDIQQKLIGALQDVKSELLADIDNIKIRYRKHVRTRFWIKFVCNFIPFKRLRHILRNKY